MIRRSAIVGAILILAMVQFAVAGTLWRIGKEDGQFKEFALGEEGFQQYQNDPVFVVGSSDPAKDWPYVQPGPADSWAQNRQHTFSIVFGLSDAPRSGDCVLHVALVNTHPSAPPDLIIVIDGQQFEQQTPRGGGELDAAPGFGKPFTFEIPFSASLLRKGANLVDITDARGSWMVYDAVSMSALAGAALEKMSTFTIGNARATRALAESGGRLWEPVELSLRHAGPTVMATISAEGQSIQREVGAGSANAELLLPPAAKEKNVTVKIAAGGQVFTTVVDLKPVRKLTVYVLPHTHHDLGYTDLQERVRKRQMENLRKAIAIAKQTADYPPGARFIWNTEVLWSVDDFLHQMPQADRDALLEAIKKGQIGLNGMYANELTGLCRPEELLQLFRFGTRLADMTGVKIDTAFQSDVPGMTWGTSEAMAQAGIKYFSLAPNHFDRIGTLMVQWQDKPFWWISPSGKQKILVWVPWMGYGLSHVIQHLSNSWVAEYEQRLDDAKFPYDISYIRWAGHGDNGEPDEAICEFIKNWNNEYVWPKFKIASAHEMFTAFDSRWGSKVPKFKGDLTPYWEDGAGSSALETGINRNASDRLVQAEALFAMAKKTLPVDAFSTAWRNVLLYSEHTWGAWCSVSNSEWAFTKAQWAVKRQFALDARSDAEKLVAQADGASGKTDEGSVEVYNTTSWPRTELVRLPKNLSGRRDSVKDAEGNPLPTQRLADGDLAVLVKDVPPLAAVRLELSDAKPPAFAGKPAARGNSLDNGIVHVVVDEKTGGISELTAAGIEGDFAKSANGDALNQYQYLQGGDLADMQGSGRPTITVVENGPLVAGLRIESQAPGAYKLIRELWLNAGADYVRIIDTIDKKRVALNPHPGEEGPGGEFAQHGAKESVSFEFPFHVPGGQIRMDIPLGMMRPEIDQLPGACKDWLPVGRYADVSNRSEGVTLATLDAPLMEFGKLSTLLGSQKNPSAWRKHIEPTQKIYSWVMNNYWGTNYRAYQEGWVTFRYALRPHGEYDAAEAARFSTGLSQPLIVAAKGDIAPGLSLVRVEPTDVLIEDIKPSDDGKAWIVRLFGASGKDRKAKLIWGDAAPAKLSISDLNEDVGKPAGSKIDVPGWGLVTIRAEYP